uniref:CC-NBS-LRR protein n=2 Tax=Quercus lobata TaxID=97700 RepID=A0A7N2LA91_QUELO
MAEGALSGVAKGIVGKAGDLVAQEIALIWGVKDEINKLKDTVSTISAVLLDAEAKKHNNEVKLWLQRLKDPMFDADDLLDEISAEALRREVMTRDKKAKEVRIFFSKSNQLAYGLRMGHKVKAMRERFDALAADRKFHLDERSEEEQGRHKAREQTDSLVRAEDVIGREDDKKAIIESLLNPNVKENVSVLPIVGIGGLGKTTVAQLVFNDEEIEKHFELKLWVCVSDDFDVKIIVKKILECVKHKKPEDLEMNLLANDLGKEINEKRYMLVLDDVWNEDREKWSKLKKILMGGAKGSRILMTTRSEIVAKISESIQPHVLKGLEEQYAWSLFKKMAFEEGEEEMNASLLEIGKEILKKCAGVPLAIRTIGGLLYFKKTEMEWLSFSINELSKIRQNESDILPTLKLSYDHLPTHLKQCFAYCSLFPKDCEINRSSLINMWMAQGFITYDKKQCPEDVGHEYFMDLLWRSFFQKAREDEFGNISEFKIHDLMHDIAIQVMESEGTIIYPKEKDIDEKTRHVSFGDTLHSSLEIPISLYKSRRIRTFLLPCQRGYVTSNLDSSTFSAIVASFKFIRLLDLHNMGIKIIPSSIKKLKHLRYLDLSKNEDIEMLPNSIVKLYNLQTLKLSECEKLKELPRDINKLVNLRFLEIDGCSGLTHMPNGLGQLTNLQTLSRFVMSEGRIDSVPRSYGGLKELGRLNELRGNLSIENLNQVKDVVLEYKDANLKEKQRLHRLDLNWVEEDTDETGVVCDMSAVEALQPHINLKALRLNRYGGVIFPHWLVTLTNLVQFELCSCNKCKYLPPLDQLPSLKIIHLERLDSLEYISNSERDYSDSLFYPSLETLYIWECPNLKGWWQGRRDSFPSFPRLSDLEIEDCPQLTFFPSFLYLEVERLSLNDCRLEYKDANLKEKQRLDGLALNWVEEDINETNVDYNGRPKDINLKALSLKRYRGVIFPHWLMSLRNLVKLKLDSCKKCQYLPPLDQFPSLKIIHLLGLNSLEHISDSERDNSDSLFYPSLELLQIEECPNLKGWWRGRRDSLPSFPRLSHLSIWNCPNQLTSFPLFPYLERLGLSKCSLNLKQSLERMMINNKTSSGNLPSSSSPSTIVAPLSKLSFMCIEEALPEECLRNLISLRTLYLIKCPLPQGMRYLTALQRLEVMDSEVVDLSNNWDEMEWQGLTTLLSLKFYELPKLVSLPVGLQYVSSLQKLNIVECPSLIAIPEWICKLISLQSLVIWDCPNLKSLPEGIGALTSLQTLSIYRCPILLKRCKKQIGEDWHKISHIPNLEV